MVPENNDYYILWRQFMKHTSFIFLRFYENYVSLYIWLYVLYAYV
jgi:hypothetical protein